MHRFRLELLKITLGEYRALREKGAPKAIPTMCVLTIKKDEQLMPLRAKSRIVVLGNRESRDWSKSDRFAPVLRFDSLRFLASLSTQHCRPLKQGDCKNAFCQGILPPEETTIVRPPSGDPDASKDEYWLLLKTLYGLCRSPRHWYNKINSILRSIGLTPSSHDPCLYTGFVRDPKDSSVSQSTDLRELPEQTRSRRNQASRVVCAGNRCRARLRLSDARPRHGCATRTSYYR